MTQTVASGWAELGQTVWRADELGGTPGATLASGYPALDAALPGAGWPLDALSELLQPPGLHAEWRLLLPALVRLQQASPGALVLVGPPHVPFGPALQAQGLAVQRLLWLTWGQRSLRCEVPWRPMGQMWEEGGSFHLHQKPLHHPDERGERRSEPAAVMVRGSDLITVEVKGGDVMEEVLTGLFPGCLASSKVGQSTSTGATDSTAGFFHTGLGG